MPRSNGPEGLAPHRQVCGARPALWAGLLFFVCLAVFWPALSQAQTAPVANPARVTVDYGSTANSVTLSIGGGAPTSVAVAGAAAHGTASASGTSITYTPVRGYAGPDSFTYTATNLDGTSAPAIVSVTVSPPSVTITPSSPHSARVGTPYTQTYTFSGGQEPYSGFFISGIPSGLSITALTANSVTISGVPQLQGSYSITVSATDSSTGDGPFRTGQLFTLTVSQLTVTLSPAGPTLPYASSGSGYSQTFSASGGTAPYTFSLAGGSFPAGITLNAATGVLSGTPTVSGTFPFSVRATDSSTGPGTPFSATNNYSLVVNAPPVIIVLSPSTLSSGKSGVSSSQTLTATGGTAPYRFAITSGALPNGITLSSAGVLSGTPTAAGAFNVTVTATDILGNNGAQAYTLVINQAVPVAVADAAATLANQAVTIPVIANDGGPITSIAVTSAPLHGTVAVNGLNAVYTPAQNFFGTDTFTYSATGPGGTSAPATVTITVSPLAVPVAAAHSAATMAGHAITIDTTEGATGGPFTGAAIVTPPAFGSATVSGTTITYIAPADASGAVSIGYTLSNAFGTSPPAMITLTVNPLPVAAAHSVTTRAGTPVTVNLTEGATGGPFTGAAIVTPPAFGSATVSGTTITYIAPAGASGAVSIGYTLSNAFGTSPPATITLTVNPLPVAAAHSVTTRAGTPVTVNLTEGATGGPFTGAAIVAPPAFGSATVSGTTITYTPPADASGAVSIGYTLSNAFGTSPPATITLTVNPLPVAAAHSVTTRAGTPVTVNLTAGATGGPFTGAAIVAPPAFGSATVSGTTITYTPPADASGAVSIGYTLSNAFGTSPPAMITLTVNPLPVAAAHSVTTRAGTPVTVNLTEGATGGPFTAATMVSLSPSGSGTANIRDSGDGGNRAFQLDFAPAAAFSGVATVSYTLGNAFTTSAPANVTITVTARADPSRDAEVIGIVNAQAEGARRFADAQLSNYSDRLRQLRRGGGNESSQGISLNTPRSDEQAKDRRDPADATPLGFFTEPRRTRPAEPFNKVVAEKPVPSRFGVWTAGQVEFGDTSGKSAGSGRDFTTSGVSAGLDYRFDERLTAGIGLGYGRDRTDIGRNGTRSEGESWSIGTYASWRPVKNTYLEAVLGYGALSFDSRRYLTDGGGFAYGSRDGQQVFGSVKAGYEISRDALYFTPYAGIDASWTKLDAFNERDGGSSSLRFGSQSVNSLVAIVGFETDYTYRFTGYTFTPSLKAEWRYDMANASDIDLSYIDWSGGPLFSLKGDGSVRNAVRLGVGFDVVLDQGLNLGLAYNTTLGEGGAIRHGFNAKAGLRF
ncbi:Ig-like domain-containing protein [Phyllobacterium myrsinacearum]|nr:Ig-like domain-containing protein [Phyllobacterium myrsinacearum]